MVPGKPVQDFVSLGKQLSLLQDVLGLPDYLTVLFLGRRHHCLFRQYFFGVEFGVVIRHGLLELQLVLSLLHPGNDRFVVLSVDLGQFVLIGFCQELFIHDFALKVHISV